MFAHTIVEAPKNGAIRRAAAISAPSVAMPTVKTSSSSGGSLRPAAGEAAPGAAVAGSVVETV